MITLIFPVISSVLVYSSMTLSELSYSCHKFSDTPLSENKSRVLIQPGAILRLILKIIRRSSTLANHCLSYLLISLTRFLEDKSFFFFLHHYRFSYFFSILFSQYPFLTVQTFRYMQSPVLFFLCLLTKSKYAVFFFFSFTEPLIHRSFWPDLPKFLHMPQISAFDLDNISQELLVYPFFKLSLLKAFNCVSTIYF